MASQLSSKPVASRSQPPQRRRRGLFAIPRNELWAYLWPVLLVIAFEAVKALHHTVFVGPNLKILDPEATAFWTLDMLVAALVTFVMIRIFLKFEEVHDELDTMGEKAEKLADTLATTSTQVSVNTDRLTSVADQVASHSEMLQTMYDKLRPVFVDNFDVADRFYSSMRALTIGWATILIEEAKNTYADDVLPGARVALRCWGSAIQCYLGEEAKDIAQRTVAANIPVYLELINTVVEDIRRIAGANERTVELFASANLLPSQYYNWGPERRHSSFMDEYRLRLRGWREGGVTIRRVIVVHKLDKNGGDEIKELHNEVRRLGLSAFDDLERDALLSIVCDDVRRMPKLLTVDEIERLVLVSFPATEIQDSRRAYAIADNFRGNVDWMTRHEIKRRLFEVFEEEIHSGSGAAKYFVLDDAGDVALMRLLPTITGADGEPQRSVDFMAIRASDGATTKTIACLAARAKPNEETLLLHFITKSDELAKIDEYIRTVDAGQAKPLTDLVQK